MINWSKTVKKFKKNLLPLKSFHKKKYFLKLAIFCFFLLLIIGVALMTIKTEDSRWHFIEKITIADHLLSDYFYQNQSPGLGNLFLWITFLGKEEFFIIITIIISALFWIWKKKNYIIPLWLSVAGSQSFVLVGKIIFGRLRPSDGFYYEWLSSFPSGHAAIAVSLYGFLGYFLFREAKSRQAKIIISITSFLIILAIGFSRLYLNVHFLSDVLGGYILGLLWLLIAISLSQINDFSKFNLPRWPEKKARAISFFLGLLLFIFYFLIIIFFNPAK